MKCLYCQGECFTSENRRATPIYTHWECKSCNAAFRIDNDQLIHKKIDFFLNKTSPQYRYMEYHLTRQTVLYVCQDIISFGIVFKVPFIIKNINPTNVKEKMKLYLTLL